MHIGFEEADPLLDWLELTDTLKEGHLLPKAEIGDLLLRRGTDTLLNRSAWIDGLGLGVKCATIYPDNAKYDLPAINGMMMVFEDTTGVHEANVDVHLVTKWKTAGDSLLSARLLARPDSKTILIMGAGVVSRTLVSAYSAAFPQASFQIWNRSHNKAEAMAAELADSVTIEAVSNLETAVEGSDIVCGATMTTEPLLKGAWLQPGQHIDLIGAYRPDMREADDEVMKRSRIFVDSRDTTVEHIGEIIDPLANGAITHQDIIADYYDIADGKFQRSSDEEITLFKNGGGAHLDLMTARYIIAVWSKQNTA